MIITISGLPGSGKSTAAKTVAKRLGFRFYSIGDLRGEIARKHGITIDELNRIGEKEDWTDREADNYLKELGKKEDNFVADSRLGFHFIPESKKIFLKVDPRVGAERIFRAEKRPDEREYTSVEDVLEENRSRVASDEKRYRKWYGVNCLDESNYDIVIDTTNLTREQTVEKILEFVKKSG